MIYPMDITNQKRNLQPAKLPPEAILKELLQLSAMRHQHLCPRQVLGVRIGLCGLRQLGLIDAAFFPQFHNEKKRLLTIVEMDGCGADGVAVATDCYVGRRTLRVVDYGKVAATLIDRQTGQAVRVWPSPESRNLAEQLAPEADSRWHAYLLGYQRMADADLLRFRPVQLTQTIAEIISKPNLRAICEQCGEEVMNEREQVVNGRILCQPCAGNSYYKARWR